MLAPAARGEQLVDDARVDEGAAAGHLADRPLELVRVLEPLLEQVGAPERAAREERGRVERLGVLAEHDDADPGCVSRSSAARRMPSSVRLGGSLMSLSTTSGSVRSISARRVSRSAHEATSSTPSSREERLDSLAREEIVLAEDDPERHVSRPARRALGHDPAHGRAAAGARRDLHLAADGADPVADADEAEALGRLVRVEADPVVLDREAAVADEAVERDRGSGSGAGVLRHVLDRLQHGVVRRLLDLVEQRRRPPSTISTGMVAVCAKARRASVSPRSRSTAG